MRRQIFFFHMVTLILALLTLLTVSGGVLHLVFRAYQDQAVPAADSRSDQVQSTLASWPEEARDWWELDQSLAKLDYRLAVEQNHQVVYSSLNRFQEDLYNRIFANASWPESGTLSLQDQGVFIVGRRCGDAVLVALMEPQTPEMFGQQRPQNEAALISFSVIGLAAIAIIGVLSFLFTQYQVRRILKPVNAIIQAAGRCNRNGRDQMGRVIVFCPEDSRRLYPDDWYNNAAVTVQEMSPPFSIHDPDNIREYYQRLFDGSTDKKTLTEAIDARSFAQTAAQYKLIDNAGVQIIVPYAEKRELYKSISKQLREQGADARILKEAASITLTCFDKNLDIYAEEIPVARRNRARFDGQMAGSRVYLLRPQYEEYYSAEMGLHLPQGEEFDGIW